MGIKKVTALFLTAAFVFLFWAPISSFSAELVPDETVSLQDYTSEKMAAEKSVREFLEAVQENDFDAMVKVSMDDRMSDEVRRATLQIQHDDGAIPEQLPTILSSEMISQELAMVTISYSIAGVESIIIYPVMLIDNEWIVNVGGAIIQGAVVVEAIEVPDDIAIEVPDINPIAPIAPVATTAPAGRLIGLEVDGIYIETDQAPFIDEANRVQAPFRAIGEALGCKVEWNEADMKVTCTREGVSVVMFIGDVNYLVNGNQKVMDSPPQIKDDRTFIPVRALGEALRCNVSWSPATLLVSITRAGS